MAARGQQTPLFAFGVIADIQYADVDDGHNFLRTRTRYYRSSLQLLRNALESWAASPVRPEFVLQLGDVIDAANGSSRGGPGRALDAVLDAFGSSALEVHHAWGNHELYNFSRRELLRSGLNSGPAGGQAPPGGDVHAYHFSPRAGFRFVLLDGYDVGLLGVEESSERYQQALRVIRQHNQNQNLNRPPGSGLQERFAMFNGGFSKKQLDWLDSVLSSSDESRERVTIVCHLPVHPDSTEPSCLAWNYEDVLALLRSHSSVACFMAGHDHDGGYHRDTDTGVHHVTFEAVVETPPDSNAFATVSVYEDRMDLKGNGRTRDRVLHFPGRCASQNQSRTPW
ncbi:manganese-dependent ADP-ribose/CDP-alcohol diphosphatase [Brachionichthys hirsutus]|uniref:manganese-dependent ADP-ribose/CDP-alcohol diphosphatase n=1 Tax=Brachionichthys hirsutus TaxID=412623 RepID=UPI003605166F